MEKVPFLDPAQFYVFFVTGIKIMMTERHHTILQHCTKLSSMSCNFHGYRIQQNLVALTTTQIFPLTDISKNDFLFASVFLSQKSDQKALMRLSGGEEFF
jgi:hypothetical protein